MSGPQSGRWEPTCFWDHLLKTIAFLAGAESEGLQLWPEIPIISTNKTPFIECIIPFITSYN